MTEERLMLLKRVYEIGKEVGARLPDFEETVSSPKEGYVVVYEWQVRNGLKFPIGDLLTDIIKQYQIWIS